MKSEAISLKYQINFDKWQEIIANAPGRIDGLSLPSRKNNKCRYTNFAYLPGHNIIHSSEPKSSTPRPFGIEWFPRRKIYESFGAKLWLINNNHHARRLRNEYDR